MTTPTYSQDEVEAQEVRAVVRAVHKAQRLAPMVQRYAESIENDQDRKFCNSIQECACCGDEWSESDIRESHGWYRPQWVNGKLHCPTCAEIAEKEIIAETKKVMKFAEQQIQIENWRSEQEVQALKEEDFL